MSVDVPAREGHKLPMPLPLSGAKGAVWSSPPFSARLILLGLGVIAAFVGILSTWATLAPLESAVRASGVVAVDTSVKTIQHLEGGIVGEILVREGQQVKSGDVLIRLQRQITAATLNQVEAEYYLARATEARLVAERDNAPAIQVPEELASRMENGVIQDAVAGQRNIFESRRKLNGQRRTIIAQTIEALEIEITGLEGQVASSKKQLELIDEELRDASKLLAQGLTNKPRVLALWRTKAEIEGQIGSYMASIGVARQRMGEAQLKIAELDASVSKEVVENLERVRSQAYEAAQKLAAAKDILQRTEIRSPIDGVVVGLKVHTIGGVITAGQALLDIVPSNDKLVVWASIDPDDIDQVKSGLPATIWLWAINRRHQAPIDGLLQNVSADRLVDSKTGQPYYLARVEFDSNSGDAQQIVIQPGMSADVMVRTGARTFWQYISAPITQALRNAFREG
ncbi:HlyD family type I secretion periplasmic adaptor subunit [Microvirga makkahensis]|uniref:Membrane fusion protein (MFP) family protein n=1 Tax=Microvirga makkahensis TaxID=1128670 RepID=A0A7X3MWI8_9HYPH|nr:HlyD family type I secretion periplasmic adaptor subunit [Microvirga makkahensis]MXQ14260.1 HlyD family type I secretion periplasmic adaptor subunit [Microvirga makkahensis]